MNKKEKLEHLNQKMSACSKCVLHCGAAKVVPGDGNPEAEIMFIGEAPGKKEDETGVPFVGSSGIILNKMLATINLTRGEVYLTNICKCRPPQNRNPLPQEVADCLPWLEKQIAIIKPKIIITLGKYALNCFLPETKIADVHGQILAIDSPSLERLKIFPLHHPAAARQNRKTRALFEADFQKIPAIVKQIKKER